MTLPLVAFIFLAFIAPVVGAVGGTIPPWPAQSVASLPSQELATAWMFALPLADFSVDGWRLVVDIILAVLVIIGFFRPQPPLHQQYAEKTEFNKHKEEIWVVVNGLRMAVSSIETSVEKIKTLREANGERLDEVSAELLQLIREVSRLNERTERHFTTSGGHSQS